MIVPFDIPGYTEGESVNKTEFFSACETYIGELESLIEDLRDDISDLKDKLDGMEENIVTYYKPRNAYELNGVRPEDFM